MSLVGTIGPNNGALRFGQTRGRIQGNLTQGVNYPSPFFDVAHTYLPVTVKQLFRWCRYYFLTNPLINATVFKLSEYPITDIIIEHDSPEVVKQWTEYFQDHLGYRAFQTEVGLDYHCYGNGIVSVGFPFKKLLKCQACHFEEQAEKIRGSWLFTNFVFRLTCPKCGVVGDAIPRDWYYKSASGIRLVRWNPEDIEVLYNDVTGDYTYFYTIPKQVENDITIGRKGVIEGVPQVFIQALRERKGVIFSKDNLFHLRRPTLADQGRGWGTPLLLPVLKDTFYLQLMKKAQEAILVEHIVPLRVLFPQASSGSADPYTTINLVDWRDQVGQEIARWRYDNNYIPILPLPIGNQTIGGDGKALLLTGEIQAWSEQIMTGMGVPKEFLLGGMSYAGTNVSMRMLENAFIGYILRHKQLARFVMKWVANAMEWPEVGIRFKPFKMADDLQRKAYRFQLNAANKISDTTLLADDDLDQESENEIMMNETDRRVEALKKQQLATAEIQGEAQLVMSKFQIKAQQEMQTAAMAAQAPGEPGAAEAGGMQSPGGQEAGGEPLPPELQQATQPQQPSGMPSFDQATGSQLNQGQKMQAAPGGGLNLNVDLPTLAMQQARLIATATPEVQQMMVQNLQTMSPELADMVVQMLASMGVKVGKSKANGSSNGTTAGVDMRPLPEQRSPRRQTQLV